MTPYEIKECIKDFENCIISPEVWVCVWARKLLDHIEFMENRGQAILQMLKSCEKILDENKK